MVRSIRAKSFRSEKHFGPEVVLSKVRPVKWSGRTFYAKWVSLHEKVLPVVTYCNVSQSYYFFLLMYIYMCLKDVFVYINQSAICVWYMYGISLNYFVEY